MNELEICENVNQKLRNGDPITDTELAVARKHYRKTVTFLRALKERRFDLFLVSLNDDLEKMDSYHESRKRHKNEH